MTLTRLDKHKRWPSNAQTGLASPSNEFAAATVVLAVAVVVLTSLMPAAGPVPTVAALVCFAASATVSGRALHLSYPYKRLGLCNAITLSRLAMTMALVGPLVAGVGASWFVFLVATTALMLDGVDGWFARRHGNASAFGARFDMEVDSLLALVLAINAAAGGSVGAAVILLGLPRYLFVVGMWFFPWLRRSLPERFSRKFVCVAQLAALIALQAPILPAGSALLVVSVALALIAWSFAFDVAWLWRRRT